MSSGLFSNLKSRYRDAYLVARATAGVGSAFKVIGIIQGILIVLISVAIGVSLGPERGAIVLFAGVILALIIAALFYVIGTIVSSQGQIPKATLDSAANNSPHIDDREKAEIMSLVSETRSESSRSTSIVEKPLLTYEPTKVRTKCKVCGKELSLTDVLNSDLFRETENLCKEHRKSSKAAKD